MRTHNSTHLHDSAPNEPTIDQINASDDAPDGLAFLIQNALDTRPDFADVWAPISLVDKMERERIRLGLSQAQVAERMGVDRTAVAKLENDPTSVGFGRIMAYARAIGVELVPKASKQKPQPTSTGKGRTVKPAQAAVIALVKKDAARQLEGGDPAPKRPPRVQGEGVGAPSGFLPAGLLRSESSSWQGTAWQSRTGLSTLDDIRPPNLIEAIRLARDRTVSLDL